MYKYLLLFVFISISFNVSAQFEWPTFTNQEDVGHCPIAQLNFADDVVEQSISYEGKDIVFRIKNYDRCVLFQNPQVINGRLEKIGDKPKQRQRVLHDKIVFFETMRYGFYTPSGYLYNNVLIEREIDSPIIEEAESDEEY